MKKTLASILAGISLAVFPFLPFALSEARAEEPKKGEYEFFANVGLTAQVEPSCGVLRSTSLKVRDASAHSEDYVTRGSLAPIEDTALDMPESSIYAELNAGISKEDEDYGLSAGLGIKWRLISELKIKERNYTSAPGTETRGYGAALTYYGFAEDPTDLIFVPGIFARASKMINKKDSFFDKLYLEYRLDFSSLNAANGWDRWANLEKNESFKLADIMEHTLKIGIEGHALDLFAGYSFADAKPTSVGRESDMEFKNHFVIGINLRADSRRNYRRGY
jgi:hypothetical protein